MGSESKNSWRFIKLGYPEVSRDAATLRRGLQRLATDSHLSASVASILHLVDQWRMGAQSVGRAYRLVSVHALLHRPALSTGLL